MLMEWEKRDLKVPIFTILYVIQASVFYQERSQLVLNSFPLKTIWCPNKWHVVHIRHLIQQFHSFDNSGYKLRLENQEQAKVAQVEFNLCEKYLHLLLFHFSFEDIPMIVFFQRLPRANTYLLILQQPPLLLVSFLEVFLQLRWSTPRMNPF